MYPLKDYIIWTRIHVHTSNVIHAWNCGLDYTFVICSSLRIASSLSLHDHANSVLLKLINRFWTCTPNYFHINILYMAFLVSIHDRSVCHSIKSQNWIRPAYLINVVLKLNLYTATATCAGLTVLTGSLRSNCPASQRTRILLHSEESCRILTQVSKFHAITGFNSVKSF